MKADILSNEEEHASPTMGIPRVQKASKRFLGRGLPPRITLSFISILFVAIFLAVSVQSFAYFSENGFCSGWGTGKLPGDHWAVGPGGLTDAFQLPSELDAIWPFPFTGIANITAVAAIFLCVLISLSIRGRFALIPFLWILTLFYVGCISTYQNYSSCRLRKSHQSIARVFPNFLKAREKPISAQPSSRAVPIFEEIVNENHVLSYEVIAQNGDAYCGAYILGIPYEMGLGANFLYPNWIIKQQLEDKIGIHNENILNKDMGIDVIVNIDRIKGSKMPIKTLYYSIVACQNSS